MIQAINFFFVSFSFPDFFFESLDQYQMDIDFILEQSYGLIILFEIIPK